MPVDVRIRKLLKCCVSSYENEGLAESHCGCFPLTPCGALFDTSYAANVPTGRVARSTIKCYTEQTSPCQSDPPTHEPHNTAVDMKVRLLQALLSFSLLSSSLSETQHKLNTVEDALAEGADGSGNAGAAAGATNSEAISDTPTIFNGAKVPPMKELTGRTFDDEVKHGYWYGYWFPRTVRP